MANLNKVFLMGNLTRDPELRYTPDGLAVAEFDMAINRQWNTPEGERKEETCFVNRLTAFGKRAEVICEYLSKGSPIFVEGRLRLDQWTDRETGDKRSRLSVVVDNFQFIGSRPGTSAPSGQAPKPQQQTSSSKPSPVPPQKSTPPPQSDEATGFEANNSEFDIDGEVPF